MNTKLVFIATAGMLFLTGCDPSGSGMLLSLQPLYTKDDLATDPILKGNWQLDEDCVLTINQSVKTADEILCSDKDGRKEKYAVHVVQLAGSQFLDLMQESAGDWSVSEWSVAGHVFAKLVPVTRDEMRMAILGSDWLDKEIAARGLQHELVGQNDRIVLTASTRELQQFVLSYANQPEAFESEHAGLHRLP